MSALFARRTSLLGLATLLASGCPARPDLWSTDLKVDGPYKLKERVVWVDSTRGLAFGLDPTAAPPTVGSVPIGRNATFVTPTADRQRLLVLTAGKEALKKEQLTEEPALFVLRAAPGGLEVVRRYALPAPFDRIAVSADGALALAHFSEDASGKNTSESFLRNPNQVALLRLDQDAGPTNPAPRTVRSFGSSPIGVVFSQPLAIPAKSGPKRTLAVLLSRGYLTLLDATNPGRREITVPLSGAGQPSSVTPRQVLFVDEPPTIFVRADGAADVFALTLEPKAAAGAGDNDFVPRINQPSTGRAILDMQLYQEEGKTFLLAATGSQEAAVIDPSTSQYGIVPLGASVDTVVGIPQAKPTTALLYSRTLPQGRVHFLKLERLSQLLGQNHSQVVLEQPVRELLVAPGDRKALVVHNSSRTVISVLDLVGKYRTETPIHGQVGLTSYDFVGETHLVGVAPGVDRLGILDLETLSPVALRLDFAPRQVMTVGERVIVDHGQQHGLVTVLPKALARRDEALLLWGFLLRDLLDTEMRD